MLSKGVKHALSHELSQFLSMGTRSQPVYSCLNRCVCLSYFECPLGLVGATGCIIFLEIRPWRYTLVINICELIRL